MIFRAKVFITMTKSHTAVLFNKRHRYNLDIKWPKSVLCLRCFLNSKQPLLLRWYEPEMPDCVRQRCSSSAEICPSCRGLWKHGKVGYTTQLSNYQLLYKGLKKHEWSLHQQFIRSKISEVIWDFDFCLLPDQQQLKNNHREDLVAES